MDPNPFKHPAIILAKIRTAIEPSLASAGFRFQTRNKPTKPLFLYLDYVRPGECFRLAWDRRDSNSFIGFQAELITEKDECTTIASMNLSGISEVPKKIVTSEIQQRLDTFVAAINDFLEKIVVSESNK